MLAAASPLPSDDTTPPVMKMYLGVRWVMKFLRCGRRHEPAHLFQIVRRVHFEGFVLCFDRLDADAVFERAQLLERLGPFERCRLERGEHEQGTAAIAVQTDMSIERG